MMAAATAHKNSWILLKILGLIFLAEGIIMIVLGMLALPPGWKEVLDPVILTTFLAPFLYFWIKREEEQRQEAQEDTRLLVILSRQILEARNLPDALTLAIREICGVAGWTYGEAWTAAVDGSRLECSALWGLDAKIIEQFSDVNKRTIFTKGVGLPGLAWAEGKPVWIADVTADSQFLRGSYARAAGLRGGWAIPVESNGRLLLILTFFCIKDKPPERMIRVVSSAASQLGALIHRKQAEDDRLRLATAIEQMTEMIMITDLKGVIEYVNEAFSSFTGLSRDEVLGKSAQSVETFAPKAELFVRLRQTIATAQSWSGRISNQRQDGTIHEEQTAIYPIRRVPGGPGNYIVLSRDITEQIALENQLRQAQKLEAVGLLAGGVAHDFNNLLTIIMGYTHLIAEEVALDSPIRSFSDSVLKASATASAVAGQLLSFSSAQIRAPKLLDLSSVIAETAQMMRRLVRANISVSTQLQADLWPVNADLNQIEQILLNLILNARDAMPEGGSIRLETSNLALSAESNRNRDSSLNPGDYVLLAVKDTGTGMNEQVRAKIFEPFFTTKAQGKGTGLGLTIILRIVKENGWHITVDTRVGQGTAFTVYIPRATGVMQVGASVQPPRTRGAGEQILLVEYDPDLRALLAKNLTDNGYRVLTASTPAEALRQAASRSTEIRLLLTDMMLAETDAMDLASRLKGLNPSLRIIHISDVGQQDIPPDVILLKKPFTTDALLAKVNSAVELNAEIVTGAEPPRA
ncbi:MAG TPA: hypothetical protein DCZ01_08955 [Elusimicrobia bacterium]|nr:MAG: hypothetical protein A2X37_02415 [Elusimicrobia bacterium GWA2_66_18]OGR76254.1 MAG: hypothetical protein A2X40_11770 [Elusimicrobia bacterium GWC2_65_9]HAZ08631.1 hypothetical protein [Elusimicrobiota bacterium]